VKKSKPTLGLKKHVARLEGAKKNFETASGKSEDSLLLIREGDQNLEDPHIRLLVNIMAARKGSGQGRDKPLIMSLMMRVIAPIEVRVEVL
jgi:hypothetical protein